MPDTLEPVDDATDVFLELSDTLECDDGATDVCEKIDFIIGVGRIVTIGSTFFRVSVQLFFLTSFSVMTVTIILNALLISYRNIFKMLLTDVV